MAGIAYERAMAAALRPGGLFAIEGIHRDWLLRNGLPVTAEEFPGGHMIGRHTVDLVAGRWGEERKIWIRGKARVQRFSIRLYTVPEMRALME